MRRQSSTVNPIKLDSSSWKSTEPHVNPLVLFAILTGMVIVSMIAIQPANEYGAISALLQPFESVGLLIFRERIVLAIVAACAWIAHFVEAFIAVMICVELKKPYFNTLVWCVWSFLVGYPVLSQLIAEKNKMPMSKHK